MRSRCLAVVLVVATAIGQTRAAVAAADSARRVIEYAKDSVTLHVTGVSAREVLGEIGRQAGAEIRGQTWAPIDTTAEFESVPLSEALHRLLAGQSFALVYGAEGQLRAIVLLAGPDATAAIPVPATVAPPTPPPAVSGTNAVDKWVDLVGRRPPMPVGHTLKVALGADRVSFTDLMNAGMRNENSVVRAEALRTALRGLATDPEMRAAYVGLWTAVDDATGATLIRGLAGENAEEFLSALATEAPSRALRRRGRAVLKQVRLH